MSAKRFCCLSAVLICAALGAADKLALKPNDRVVYIGNTFAERLSKAGYFETLLLARHPEHKLTFRNLGWSADTLTIQLRPLNFGDLHTHLHEQKPDVIFACYGMAESFEGISALPQFEKDLESFLKLHLNMNYSGKGNARMVVVGPICHENLGGDFPDPAKHNEVLKAYSDTMKKVAAALNLPFLDLFTKTQEIMNVPKGAKLTFNGLHLTDYGNWVVAQLMLEELGLATQNTITIDAQNGTASATGLETGELKKAGPRLSLTIKPTLLPVPPPPVNNEVSAPLLKKATLLIVKGLAAGQYELRIAGSIIKADAAALAQGMPLLSAPGSESAEQLRLLVDDKNWHFYMRYRAVNGEYIYGRRKEPFGVKNFPAEFELLDKMIGEQDGKIWQAAKSAGPAMIEIIRADGKD